jgi:2'-5' RNA ligase
VLQFFPAHLSLLAPFAPLPELPAACKTLRVIGAGFAPFEVTLEGYGRFKDGDGAFMQPVKAEALHSLFNAIFGAFPQYPPYGGQWGTDYDPHVTLASRLDAEAMAAMTLPPYEPLRFVVDRFHVLYGSFEAAVPFITYDVIHLTG